MSTTIITRLYPDTGTADAVLAALLKSGQDTRTIDVISGSGARDRMRAAQVTEQAAAAYAEGVESGNALVVVRAPFVPFGTALRAIRIVDEFPSIDAGVSDQNAYLGEKPGETVRLSVLKGSPLMLTRRASVAAASGETVSADLGIPLLTEDRPHLSAIPGGAFVSKKFWPMPLLTKDKHPDSVFHGDVFMSRRFWPMPLLSMKKRRESVIPGGGTPFSTLFGLPLLINR